MKNSILLSGLVLALVACVSVLPPPPIAVKVNEAEVLPDCAPPYNPMDQVTFDGWLHRCAADHTSRIVAVTVYPAHPQVDVTNTTARLHLDYTPGKSGGTVSYWLMGPLGDVYEGVAPVSPARSQTALVLSRAIASDEQSERLVYAQIDILQARPARVPEKAKAPNNGR